MHNPEICTIFASQLRDKRTLNANGPFVYRLGRKIFILERAVRFRYGLLFLCIISNKISHNIMANHKSSIKRIRQTERRRLHNKFYAKVTRSAVRKLRATSEKDAAVALLPKVASMLDKLAKRNIIHKNKASNLKSKLALHVNKLA